MGRNNTGRTGLPVKAIWPKYLNHNASRLEMVPLISLRACHIRGRTFSWLPVAVGDYLHLFT